MREETLRMLREGLSPKEISRARGVNINTTLGYIDELVGRGDLRGSDIFFSVPKDIRNAITVSFSIGRTIQEVIDLLRELNISEDSEDVIVVIKYGDLRHALGDMYEDIRIIETHLHQIIQEALEEEYGEGPTGWWRQGIPQTVRTECVVRQEADSEAVPDPYCYTELLDLWRILNKQWGILSKVLPRELTKRKQDLEHKLGRLNAIRNNVMHPVRGIVPSEDDFEFVRDLLRMLVRLDSEED